MQLHKPNLQEFLAAIKSSSTCSRNALRICSGNFLVLEISSSVIKNNQLLGSQARGKDSWIATYSCAKSDTGFRCCVFTSMSNNFCTLCGDFWADSHSGSSTMPAALLRVDHRTLVAVGDSMPKVEKKNKSRKSTCQNRSVVGNLTPKPHTKKALFLKLR